MSTSFVRRTATWLILATAMVCGCAASEDTMGGSPTDGGGADTKDGAVADSGALDTGSSDSSRPDTGSGDTATTDTGVSADADAGPPCTGDLSGIGTADFQIAFTITVAGAPSAVEAVLNQRGVCGAGNFWDVRLGTDGKLSIETDTSTLGADYTTLVCTLPVGDGTAHDVVFARTAGTLTCRVDGAAAGSASSTASFATLAALATATDVCIGADGTVALGGTVTKVCVSH
jgi:hypothetical protein